MLYTHLREIDLLLVGLHFLRSLFLGWATKDAIVAITVVCRGAKPDSNQTRQTYKQVTACIAYQLLLKQVLL